MKRSRAFYLIAGVVLTAFLLSLGQSDASENRSGAVTFTKDVAPILNARCVECHRAGEIAPMSLASYKEVRPWARSIREKVVDRTMPPWLADAGHEHFANERRLTQKEIDTITAWVDAGAPKGDDKELPPAPSFTDGWAMGKPDVIFYLPEDYSVPAEGTIPYQYITVKTELKEDRWIQAAEIRPGNRAVVHHVIVNIREPKSSSQATANAPAQVRERGFKLAGYAPGEQPKVYPKGTAKLLKAGSELVFQMHYTTNGVAQKDRSYIGMYFAKEPVQKHVLTGTATNAQFVIPAGHPNYEVQSKWEAKEDVYLVDLMPHMHVRGRDFKYTVVYPDGRSEVILNVPRYDFNWQLLYQFKKPLLLTKGSRLECVAHFDNSTGNKFNPDPSKEVRWGDQTWEEMMIGWFDYTLAKENLLSQTASK
jgi:mono/diheme cytochrome c family protein